MAGLLGMGGFGGGNDMALQSLLGEGYDPRDMRNARVKRGLLDAGIAMLSQGNSATPIGFGQMLGQGLGAGINGADQAQQDYMGQAKMAYDVKRQGINDAWSQKEQARKEQEWAEQDKRKQAFESMLGGLPEDQRGMAQAYPEEYGKQQFNQMFPEQQSVPSSFAGLDMQAQAGGLQKGSPQYQEFMRNGGSGGAPASFVALDMQAKAAGLAPGSPEYQDFMGTRGAGLIADAKERSKVVADYNSVASKLPGLELVVTQLEDLADKATYTSAGQAADYVGTQLGFDPRDAAVARSDYIAMVDNQVLPMLRDIFGAAFTVKEGETLRATLGQPNLTPIQKKGVLRTFIEQQRRNVQALAAQSGRTLPPAPQGGKTVEDMSDAELEAIANGQ